jgi:hypothetical protein
MDLSELGIMISSSTQPDQLVWKSLRQAIVESPGFQSWLEPRLLPMADQELDDLVRAYLDQTLSTLAY